MNKKLVGHGLEFVIAAMVVVVVLVAFYELDEIRKQVDHIAEQLDYLLAKERP